MDPTKISLYDLLGVKENATQAEITKAYRLLALKVHPDKNLQDYENAQKNFQKLNEAYLILNDPRKREAYDKTGDTETNDEFFEAYDYYRGIYKKVSEEDIDNFAVKYKGSSEEVEDLVRFYLEHDGDMKQVLFWVPLSEKADLPRFWKTLDELIKAKKIPKSKRYAKSKSKVKEIREYGGEIIEEEKDEGKNSMQMLISKIKGKQGNSDEFFEYLEKKYQEPPKKRKKNK